jgi:phosphoribosylaminoimidazole carboxylase PurE protein
VAAHSSSPVLGVPTEHSLNGLDAILSTLQMPAGVPVATFAAGTAGATNAGIFAAQMLGVADSSMAEMMIDFKKELREKTIKKDQNLDRD